MLKPNPNALRSRLRPLFGNKLLPCGHCGLLIDDDHPDLHHIQHHANCYGAFLKDPSNGYKKWLDYESDPVHKFAANIEAFYNENAPLEGFNTMKETCKKGIKGARAMPLPKKALIKDGVIVGLGERVKSEDLGSFSDLKKLEPQSASTGEEHSLFENVEAEFEQRKKELIVPETEQQPESNDRDLGQSVITQAAKISHLTTNMTNTFEGFNIEMKRHSKKKEKLLMKLAMGSAKQAVISFADNVISKYELEIASARAENASLKSMAEQLTHSNSLGLSMLQRKIQAIQTAMKPQVVKALFDADAEPTLDFVLKDMQPTLSSEDIAKLKKYEQKIKTLDEFDHFKLSPIQLGCALMAVFNFKHKKERRQIWTVPTGRGKQRIICAVTLLATQMNNKIKKVYVVFANDRMLDREKKVFNQFKSVCGNLELITASDFDLNRLTADTLVVLDEADYALLDVQIPVGAGAGFMIGFTATPFKNTQSKSIEQKYLDSHNFVLHSSLYPNKTFGGNDVIEISLVDFLAPEGDRLDMVRLIYCEKSYIEEIRLHADGTELAINETKEEVLGKLDDHVEKIFVVTEEELMRGFDYRAPVHGIKLLVARSFLYERQASQGLGRVGRFNDKGKRYLLRGTSLIDHYANMALVQKLNNLVK